MKETAKFEIKDLLGIAFTIIVMGVGIAYGLDVMNDANDDLCSDAGGTLDSGVCKVCNNITVWNASARDCYNTTTGAPFASNAYTVEGDGTASGAVTDASSGVGMIPAKLPTIATVIVASVIIGILVTYLWMKFQ